MPHYVWISSHVAHSSNYCIFLINLIHVFHELHVEVFMKIILIEIPHDTVRKIPHLGGTFIVYILKILKFESISLQVVKFR